MVTEVNKNTFASVYKDDFRDSDNFHRILFNSGRSLQARELTQLQTIIQREIGRLGNHIFKDGAAVNPIGGGVSPNKNYPFIKLDPISNNFDGLTASQLVGRLFVGSVSGVKLRILEALPANATDPATLYVAYTETPNNDQGYFTAAASEVLTETATGKELTVASTNPTGYGVQVNVAGGDFYATGHFIFAPPQSLIVSKYTNLNVDANIGYIVKEEVVTELDDDRLYDNQGVNPNRAAPGADRYRIRLELATESSAGPEDQFVKFFEMVNGEAKKIKTGIEDYNKPNDFQAQRTREAEGDYLVDPFLVKMLPGDSEGNLFLETNEFVAYVDGYRVAGGTKNSTKKPHNILKPTSTTASSAYASSTLTTRINLRNYILLDSNNGFDNYSSDTILDKVNLYDNTNAVIGTTRVLQYEYVNDAYYAYLFGTNLNNGESLRSVAKIGNSTTNYILPKNPGAVRLQDAGGANLLLPLYLPRVASVSGVNFEAQREANITATANSIVVSSANDEPFEDTDNWIVVDITNNSTLDTQVLTFTDSGGGLSPYQMTITGGGITTGRNYKVIYIIDKSVANFISKTLNTSTVSNGTTTTDSSGVTFLELGGDIDIYEIDSVKDSVNGLIDLKSNFRLDNGNRDDGYFPGRLVQTTPSLPSNVVYVKYKHFVHSPSGDYYSLSSYSGLLADSEYGYADVPVHTTAAGRSVRLADHLDFRSTYNRSGQVVRKVDIPKNASNLAYDLVNYNGRVDILVANKDGRTYVKRGQESLNPVKPKIEYEKELPLYVFKLNPNTLGPGDLTSSPISHKKFSYRDLTRLEDRLEQLEEAVSLSLLETKTKDLLIQATDGTVRAKSGFFVDNFTYFPSLVAGDASQQYEQVDATQSINRVTSIVGPKSFVNHADIMYDSAGSTNIMLRGNSLYLKHREVTDAEVLYSNEAVTSPKNVNPFLIREVEGRINLSPNEDQWVDTKNLPDNILPDLTEISAVALNGDTSWADGYSADQFTNGASVGVLNTSTSVTNTSPGEPIVSDPVLIQHRRRLTTTLFTTDTERTTITDRITGVASNTVNVGSTIVQYTLPFLRQKKVYFKAEALRPNTVHYPYFDGVPVGQWCREEAVFYGPVVASGDGATTTSSRPEADDLYDETSPTMEEHPSGSTELRTNTFGELIGSFFIPNTGKSPKVGTRTVQGAQPGATLEDNGILDWEANYNAAVRRSYGQTTTETGVNVSKAVGIYNAVGWRFRAGSPLAFQLLDVPTYDPDNAFSKCAANYSAEVGQRTTTQRNMQTTTTVTIAREVTTDVTTTVTGIQNTITTAPHDPLAQTFYVYGDERPTRPSPDVSNVGNGDFPQGMWVNSVDVFIRRAPRVSDEQVPLVLELREVMNGVPKTSYIPGTFATRSAADIRSIIGADADGVTSATTQAEVLAMPVRFTFVEPIFLAPNDYYAFVLKADTDRYQAWISTVGEYEFGNNTVRTQVNNITGSLFESQNASTWSPLQNSDLAYRIRHLRFTETGTARFINKKLARHEFAYDNMFSIDSSSNRLLVNHPGHGFFPGDHPQILGLDSATRYAGILGSTIMNRDLSVDSVDAKGYSLVLDSSSDSAAVFGTAGITSLHNVMYDKFRLKMTGQVNPTNTSMLPRIKMLSGQSYASSVDDRFQLAPSFLPCTFDTPVYLPSPKMVLNDSAENANAFVTGGTIVKSAGTPGKSLELQIDFSAKDTTDRQALSDPTFKKVISPAISVANANIGLHNYFIDNQGPIAQPSSLVNTAITYIPETNPLGGSTPSKHITKPVIIKESAIGLKILMDAYRPPEANFDMYYRVCQADENIYSFDWILVNPVEGGYPAAQSPVNTPYDAVFLEYEYFAGDETGVTPAADITSFTQFQVKVVMRSTNTSRQPYISNIRVLSLIT